MTEAEPKQYTEEELEIMRKQEDQCSTIKRFLCYEGENATKNLLEDSMALGFTMAKHFNALGLQGLAMRQFNVSILNNDTRVVCEAVCLDVNKLQKLKQEEKKDESGNSGDRAEEGEAVPGVQSVHAEEV